MSVSKLTLKQKNFCIKYVESGGNGVIAVIDAGYDIKNNKNLASVIAYENLRKPHIQGYLDELYKSLGLNESKIESEHAYLTVQRIDLSVKVKAIELYYKITGRYANTDPTENKVNADLADALQHIRNLIPN